MVGIVACSVAFEFLSVSRDLPVFPVATLFYLETGSLTIVGELVLRKDSSFGRSIRSYDTVPYIFVTKSLLSLYGTSFQWRV